MMLPTSDNHSPWLKEISFPGLIWITNRYYQSPVSIASIVLLVLILIVFGGSLNYEMLGYDSKKYILEDPAIRQISWQNVYQIFTTNYFVNYNPLHRISYMLDYSLWGDSPAGYRVMNWGLHWIGAIFVFAFFLQLTRNHISTWLLTICFAIHPTRVENVVWLAQRKDVLAAAFGFAALWCYQQSWKKSSAVSHHLWYLMTILTYSGAVASKAQWVPLCAILFCLDWYEAHPRTQWQWIKYLPFVGLSGLFSWWTYQAQILEPHQTATFSFITWVTGPLRDIAQYFRLTLWPINLYARTPPFPIVAWQAILGGAILMGWGITGWKKRNDDRSLLFGLSWFLLFLLPMLNLVPGTLMPNDRYLYVSILGIVFPLAQWLGQQPVRQGLSSIVLSSVVFGSLTVHYLPVWKNDYSLWNNSVLQNPNNQVAIHNLMISARLEGKKQEESFLLEYLVSLDPQNLVYRSDAGIAAYKLGNYPKAAEHLGWLSKYDPKFQDTASDCFRLGHALVMTQQAEQAIPFLRQAVKLEPNNPQYWYTFGDAHKSANHLTEALQCYQKVLNLEKKYTEKVQPKIILLEGEIKQSSQKPGPAKP